ncbi:MAG: hypothetical protein A3B81_02440 [Candidatus Muproteobacteria bacterium RIFCSPHIGHO2_02_FULL_65_16]|uniref:RNA polymerase subunit sigma n=1 Tax=Candidatus Muproteobacteria bacterium RIFCSPHIGHO2_02_FULL_65_16 TaxID=1817766 RepID=A0A1F6U4F4_9PROT|nr:MAG: hypothetical protein A3B81_02440 [Candidatus Muproteobacteria bacterium RIFCSPHIGHO2_02_FULL_65_16]
MEVAVKTGTEAGRLLERIACGESGALEQFYEAFHGRVYAFVLRRLNNPADAAEILNEVMLEVWRSAARFEGRSQPLTWVLGIAHHKVLDRLRRAHTANHEEITPDIAPADEVSAVEALAGAEDAELVRRCLDKLTDSHRLVVHLAFFNDLSYHEIAEIVNCPLGTVKTRMFYAKQVLKRCLAGQRPASL